MCGHDKIFPLYKMMSHDNNYDKESFSFSVFILSLNRF